MDEYYDEESEQESDDYEFWEFVLQKVIARQGPQYSEYQSCMWE